MSLAQFTMYITDTFKLIELTFFMAYPFIKQHILFYSIKVWSQIKQIRVIFTYLNLWIAVATHKRVKI